MNGWQIMEEGNQWLLLKIDGPPFGKPAVASDRLGNRYRPKEVTAFYQKVHWLVARAWKNCDQSLPMAAPMVTIVAMKHRPQKRPKDYPLNWTDGRNPCLAKPDVDNISKALLDALTRAKVWDDDQKVCSLMVSTFYAAQGEEPHTLVTVTDLAQGQPFGSQWSKAANET